MGVYKQKKSSKWYIDYYLPGGKRVREVTGSSKKLAEKLLARRKAEILERKYNVNRPDPIRFSELTDEFLEYCKASKKPNTYLFHKTNPKNLNLTFKDRFVDEITAYEIEQYKVKGVAGVSPSTVNRELATLNHMFELAREWGKIVVNPVKDVKKLKEPPGKVRYLSKKEIKSLVKHCKIPYLKIAVLIALNTGMRKGEILSQTPGR